MFHHKQTVKDISTEFTNYSLMMVTVTEVLEFKAMVLNNKYPLTIHI